MNTHTNGLWPKDEIQTQPYTPIWPDSGAYDGLVIIYNYITLLHDVSAWWNKELASYLARY